MLIYKGDFMENDIDLNLYKIFSKVAETKNITKAAEKLYVSQPAITKSIKQLEKNLGGTLFIRTKKGVELTEEGKVLYLHVKKILDDISNAQNKFSSLINLEEGKIRIGASATVTKHFLMPYIEKFHNMYPSIEICIVNELTKNLVKDLKYGYLDFLVTNMPINTSSDLNVEVCAKLHDTFATSKKYIDFKNKKIKLSDIEKYKTIAQKEPSNTREFLNNFMKQNDILFKPDIEIVSYALVVEFIKSGFGIGYVTKEFVKEELKNGDIYEVLTDKEIPERNLGIVTLKNNIPNFASQKFIELLKEDIDY